MIQRFNEVAIKGTKKFVDAAGKKHSRTRKFFQTLNPYNKMPTGDVKTRDDIMMQLVGERTLWMNTPESDEEPKKC